jgi:hypothetical protein
MRNISGDFLQTQKMVMVGKRMGDALKNTNISNNPFKTGSTAHTIVYPAKNRLATKIF